MDILTIQQNAIVGELARLGRATLSCERSGLGGDWLLAETARELAVRETRPIVVLDLAAMRPWWENELNRSGVEYQLFTPQLMLRQQVRQGGVYVVNAAAFSARGVTGECLAAAIADEPYVLMKFHSFNKAQKQRLIDLVELPDASNRVELRLRDLTAGS